MKKSILLLLMLCAGTLYAQTGTCVSGNCVTGKGKMVYNDGSFYEGDFVNGSRQGKGTLDADDHVYKGDWKENNYSGRGVLGKRAGRGKYFYQEYDCTFVAGSMDGPGRYGYFDGDDTTITYVGNFKNGEYYGKGSMHIKSICTFYSDSWTDSQNFTAGKYVQDKTLITLYGSYVANGFERGENNGTTPPGQASAKAFKRFYFHRNNSAFLRDNLMTTELVNTLPGPKTGSITINLIDNSLKIAADGDADKIYTIKKVGDETTNQYSDRKLIIFCTDASGTNCTATIRREYAYTSDNEMIINITYPNGTGKGYFCTYEANLFTN